MIRNRKDDRRMGITFEMGYGVCLLIHCRQRRNGDMRIEGYACLTNSPAEGATVAEFQEPEFIGAWDYAHPDLWMAPVDFHVVLRDLQAQIDADIKSATMTASRNIMQLLDATSQPNDLIPDGK